MILYINYTWVKKKLIKKLLGARYLLFFSISMSQGGSLLTEVLMHIECSY